MLEVTDGGYQNHFCIVNLNFSFSLNVVVPSINVFVVLGL